jgi:prophage tail gpP-like protein
MADDDRRLTDADLEPLLREIILRQEAIRNLPPSGLQQRRPVDPAPGQPVPNPDEVATLVVEDFRFDAWESIFVQHRANEGWPIFKFRAVEKDPPPELQTLSGVLTKQFMPQQIVQVYLAGRLAMNGFITTRQVAYASEEHGIEIAGKGIQWAMSRASYIGNANFDGQNFLQIVTTISRHFGLPQPVVRGELDLTPYKTAQMNPGERVFAFLERYARVRKIGIGTDWFGAYILWGNQKAQPTDRLVEGVNILRMQALFSIDELNSDYWVKAQGTGSDGHNMAQSSEMIAETRSKIMHIYSPKLTPQEIPVWNQAEVKKRADYEAIYGDGTITEAHITVQGWKRSDVDDIWRIGQAVYVYSPMVPLDMVMKVQTATFTQDRDSGTTTLLHCVPPWLYGVDDSDYNTSAVPQIEDPSTGVPPPMVLPPGAPFYTPPPLFLPSGPAGETNPF